MEEKTQALILLEQGMSVVHVAADLRKVTRMVIYNLIKAVDAALPDTVPQHKEDWGTKEDFITN